MTVCTILLHIRIYCLLYATTLTGLSQSFRAEYTVRRGPASDVQCMSQLTGSSQDFPDEAFTASSSLYDRVQFQPAKARLTEVYGSNEHTSGHAWCPNSLIGESLQEWIQADFPHLVMISTIFTAGRGDGNVKEFMPSFVLRYQRESGGPWLEHTKLDGTRILKANSDPRNLARVTLDTVVTALRIRIYPYSRKSNQPVCLRFALLGCEFPDGVVAYSMTQGSSPQPVGHNNLLSGKSDLASYNLRDLSYDGQRSGQSRSQLTEGMGQLMDNIAYLGNITNLVPLHPGQPGFHFVGWQQPQAQQQLQQRQQLDPSGVQIDFKFNALRRFTWLRLFTFDSVPLQARLFNRIAVAFGRDGASYGSSSEAFTSQANLIDPRSMEWLRVRSASDDHRGQSMRPRRSHRSQSGAAMAREVNIYTDHEFEGALVLQMQLDGQVGRYLRLSLTGGDKWILLSEVQFNSTLVIDETAEVETNPIAKQYDNADLESLKATAEDTHREQGGDTKGLQGNTSSSKSGTANQDDNGQANGGVKDPSPLVQPGLYPVASDAGEKPPSEMSTMTSDFNQATLLPFIIVLACLLCIVPGVILLWFCSRRHCGEGGGSPLYCHRKGFFHSTRGDHAAQSSNCAKEYSRHQEVATKLLATGAYSGPSNGAATQLLTSLLQQQQQHLHSPNHLANFTCSANMNLNQTSCNSPPGASVNPSTAGASLPSASVRSNVHTGVILQCSPSSSCSSHAVAAAAASALGGANADCLGTVFTSPNQEAHTSLAIGTASGIYARAGDPSCMSGVAGMLSVVSNSNSYQSQSIAAAATTGTQKPRLYRLPESGHLFSSTLVAMPTSDSSNSLLVLKPLGFTYPITAQLPVPDGSACGNPQRQSLCACSGLPSPDSCSLYTSIRTNSSNVGTDYWLVPGTTGFATYPNPASAMRNLTMVQNGPLASASGDGGDASQRSPTPKQAGQKESVITACDPMQQLPESSSCDAIVFAETPDAGNTINCDREEEEEPIGKLSAPASESDKPADSANWDELNYGRPATNVGVNLTRRTAKPFGTEGSATRLRTRPSSQKLPSTLPWLVKYNNSNAFLHRSPSNELYSLRLVPELSLTGLVVAPFGPEYASASIFGFTPPPSDQASTVLPPGAVPTTNTTATSSTSPPSPPPPPLPPNRMEHLRPITSLPSTKNYTLSFAHPSGHSAAPLLVPMLMNGSQSTTLRPLLGGYPPSILAEDPSFVASTLQRRFHLANSVSTSQGGENACGPGAVGNGIIFLPQSSFDTVIPIGTNLSQVVPDIEHQSDGLYHEIPGTRPIQAIAPTALYHPGRAGQLMVDPNQLPPDLQRHWRLANLYNPSNPAEADAHWPPEAAVIPAPGMVDHGAANQQQHHHHQQQQPYPQHLGLVNCLPPQPALTALMPHQQINTGITMFPQPGPGFAETYRVNPAGGYLHQSSTGTSARKNSGSGNCDGSGRLSLYSMCV